MRPPIKHCSQCGGETRLGVPPSDDRERFICVRCGQVHYQNPRNVVGCLVEQEGRVLLCKRAIQPRVGTWTLPAGFQELGEGAMHGAVRETYEETGARVEIAAPYVHFDIPHIGQSYVFYRARLLEQVASPGPETLEARFFRFEDVPWQELSFDVVRISLDLYIRDMQADSLHAHYGTIVRDDDRPGIRLGSCSLQDHLVLTAIPAHPSSHR